MRRINRVALRQRGEDASFRIVPEVMNVYSMARDGKRCYRPYERGHEFHPGDYVMTYRQWFRWVKAK